MLDSICGADSPSTSARPWPPTRYSVRLWIAKRSSWRSSFFSGFIEETMLNNFVAARAVYRRQRLTRQEEHRGREVRQEQVEVQGAQAQGHAEIARRAHRQFRQGVEPQGRAQRRQSQEALIVQR